MNSQTTTDYKLEIKEHIENFLEQYFRNSVGVWHKGSTPKERQPHKRKFKREATQALAHLINKARIDELKRLQNIDAFNSAYIFQGDQRQEKIIRNRIKELEGKE